MTPNPLVRSIDPARAPRRDRSFVEIKPQIGAELLHVLKTLIWVRASRFGQNRVQISIQSRNQSSRTSRTRLGNLPKLHGVELLQRAGGRKGILPGKLSRWI